ncbi:MAG: hypothetical protein JWQ40_307 [Segetibacter sp.]|nr:hypothetical protein [Segetibacter sp.]
MKHEIHYIRSFNIVGLHTLEVIFENNTRKTIDLAPVLYGEMYGALRDPEFLNK